MDARAMDHHEWDDCGHHIAALFKEDELKFQAIRDAWWDTDEDDQQDIHKVMCEHNRNPEAIEAAQVFEKLAAEYEAKYRKQEQERQEKADARKAAMEKAAQTMAARVTSEKQAEAGGIGIGDPRARVQFMEDVRPNSYFINTPNPTAAPVASAKIDEAW